MYRDSKSRHSGKLPAQYRSLLLLHRCSTVIVRGNPGWFTSLIKNRFVIRWVLGTRHCYLLVIFLSMVVVMVSYIQVKSSPWTGLRIDSSSDVERVVPSSVHSSHCFLTCRSGRSLFKACLRCNNYD